MSTQITEEARRAADLEREVWWSNEDGDPWKTMGSSVQALLDARDQRHAEEIKELRDELSEVRQELHDAYNNLTQFRDQAASDREAASRLREQLRELREAHGGAILALGNAITHAEEAEQQLRAKESEAQQCFSGMVESNQALSSLRADNDRLKEELERATHDRDDAWKHRDIAREQWEKAEKERDEALQQLEAVTRDRNEWRRAAERAHDDARDLQLARVAEEQAADSLRSRVGELEKALDAIGHASGTPGTTMVKISRLVSEALTTPTP